MKKNIVVVVLCGIPLIIGGCARNIETGTYDARTIGETASTYYCKVINVRKVKVEEGDRLEDNSTGILVGGVTGGMLGNTVGGGRGRAAATAAGAMAGAAAGAYAEKFMKSQYGFEYVVELQSGELKTVVQGGDVILAPGQAALLMEYQNGRSRLIPR
jgi:outer membrane lipoprotein SlyB